MKLPGTDVELDPRLEPLLVPIGEVTADAMNPRQVVDIGKLVRRIERYGYTDPVVVNRNTSVIAAGHMRHAACRELGATHVPVIFVDHDPVQARAYNIAHNRSAEDVAAWEPEALAELLEALKDEDEFFDAIGFTDEDLAALHNEPFTIPPSAFADDAPPPPVISRPGHQVDTEGFKLQHRCPRCGMEFND